MKITVFGCGYVGLVQAAVMAEVGHDVLCIDLDEAKIAHLRNGQVPIFEPGLEALVQENLRAGRLSFDTDPVAGVSHGGVQFVAVGTPPLPDGSADLKHVLSVVETIGRNTTTAQTIITKSTVPVGTADKMKIILSDILLARRCTEIVIDVVSNPEFLKEGSALGDCMRPDRIVVGTSRQEAEALLREIYAPFNRNHEKIIVMDERSAELTKYAANCMLATKISFMNEMAGIAERLGADVEMVRQGIGSDPRIGYQFIYAGAGYGGSCFPKDIEALIHSSDTVGFDAKVLKSVKSRNAEQKRLVFSKMEKHFKHNLSGRTFALWGLAFKPDTDDMREAPSRTLIDALLDVGASIKAFDPEAMNECRRIYGPQPRLTLCETKYEALRNAEALVIMTDWKSFQAPDFDEIKRLLTQPVLFDGRNLFNPDMMAKIGISYYGIGRGLPI